MWHSSAQPFFICVFELSISITSIIFLFNLVHLNDLFCDIVEEVNVKGVLKSLIFVVQKATAPKTGAEFHQGSIGAISSSLATSCNVWRRHSCTVKKIHTQTNGLTDRKVTYRARLPSLKMPHTGSIQDDFKLPNTPG